MPMARTQFILLHALGLKPGDEVIVPAHSWISTSETVSQAGGTVVFCDTQEMNFAIDVEAIEEKITKNTVGIIPVHLYGHPAQMDEVLRIATKHSSGLSRIAHRPWRLLMDKKLDSSVI